MTEDAFIFFGRLNDGADGASQLRQELATLATYYQQESIGFSLGVGELISSYDIGVVTAEQAS